MRPNAAFASTKSPRFSFSAQISARINECSFLADGINPFHRDGVYLNKIDARLIRDSKQPGAAAIIDQVAQVSLLRVILPWMIGKAFERLSDQQFIQLLGEKVQLPLPNNVLVRAAFGGEDKVALKTMLDLAAGSNEKEAREYRRKVGQGVQAALKEQFKKYDLTGKTWATLTRSTDEKSGEHATAPEQTPWTDFGITLSAVGAVVHGDVSVLPGDGGRLGVRYGAAPGDAEAAAFRRCCACRFSWASCCRSSCCR